MQWIRSGAVVAVVAWASLSTACASTVGPAPESPDALPSETAHNGASTESPDTFGGLDQLADTEWTGLDHLRDRITFIFHADGRVSYRNELGEFNYEGDTWSVDGDVLTFQADYRGPFGVASHTGGYDHDLDALLVEYTTTTNRSGTYTLYLLD